MNKLIYLYLRWVKGIALPRDLIEFTVQRYASRPAVRDGNICMTYRQLFNRAQKLADALSCTGMAKGDRLGILIYNSYHYFEIRIATYLTGIVLVPLGRDLSLDAVRSICQDCEVKSLIYHPSLWPNPHKDLGPDTPMENAYPVTGQKEGSYEHLLKRGKIINPQTPLEPDDLASINFSSGTTGRPKGIELTQTNWITSFYQYLLNSRASLKTGFVFLHVIPLATAGSTAVLPCFAKGALSVVTNDFDPEKTVRLINDYQVARLFLPSSWFIGFLNYCRKTRTRLPSLKGITVGTAPLAAEKLKAGIAHFGPIIEIGYGMAEILPPLFLLSARDYSVKGQVRSGRLDTVGRRLKGVEARIVDENKQPLAVGARGRIAVKSPTIARGYLNRPGLTRAHFDKGWFYSDDYGCLDKEGYLRVLGRRQDILRGKKGDRLYFAREIDEALQRHQDITESCVYQNAAGQVTACVSVKDAGAAPEPETIRRFCRDALPDFLVPDKIMICEKLPLKTTGKLDKEKLLNK